MTLETAFRSSLVFLLGCLASCGGGGGGGGGSGSGGGSAAGTASLLGSGKYLTRPFLGSYGVYEGTLCRLDDSFFYPPISLTYPSGQGFVEVIPNSALDWAIKKISGGNALSIFRFPANGASGYDLSIGSGSLQGSSVPVRTYSLPGGLLPSSAALYVLENHLFLNSLEGRVVVAPADGSTPRATDFLGVGLVDEAFLEAGLVSNDTSYVMAGVSSSGQAYVYREAINGSSRSASWIGAPLVNIGPIQSASSYVGPGPGGSYVVFFNGSGFSSPNTVTCVASFNASHQLVDYVDGSNDFWDFFPQEFVSFNSTTSGILVSDPVLLRNGQLRRIVASDNGYLGVLGVATPFGWVVEATPLNNAATLFHAHDENFQALRSWSLPSGSYVAGASQQGTILANAGSQLTVLRTSASQAIATFELGGTIRDLDLGSVQGAFFNDGIRFVVADFDRLLYYGGGTTMLVFDLSPLDFVYGLSHDPVTDLITLDGDDTNIFFSGSELRSGSGALACVPTITLFGTSAGAVPASTLGATKQSLETALNRYASPQAAPSPAQQQVGWSAGSESLTQSPLFPQPLCGTATRIGSTQPNPTGVVPVMHKARHAAARNTILFQRQPQDGSRGPSHLKHASQPAPAAGTDGPRSVALRRKG